MTLDEIQANAIGPACAVLGHRTDTPEARIMLLAIGLQESRFVHRFQVVGGKAAAIAAIHGETMKGPARGFWQFEKGGVRGVWRHHVSTHLLRDLCLARGCAFDPVPIWERIETDDILAAGVARLLLLTDPFALPKATQSDSAWAYYSRNWRPGKPHPRTWADNHAAAVAAVIPPHPRHNPEEGSK